MSHAAKLSAAAAVIVLVLVIGTSGRSQEGARPSRQVQPAPPTELSSASNRAADKAQEAAAVAKLIDDDQLDPDYLHLEGPFYVRLPAGDLVFYEQLLSFGPEPFGMTVALTNQPDDPPPAAGAGPLDQSNKLTQLGNASHRLTIRGSAQFLAEQFLAER